MDQTIKMKSDSAAYQCILVPFEQYMHPQKMCPKKFL